MTDNLKFSCIDYENILTAIAFSSDGLYLATAGLDTTAKVWDVQGDREISKVYHEDIVVAIAFSPSGHYFATASEDTTAQVWETKTGRRIACLQHEDSVRHVAFCLGGEFLVTITGSKVFPRASPLPCTATIWEISTGRKAIYVVHPHGLNTLAFSPRGTYLALADMAGTVGVWETNVARRAINLIHRYNLSSTAAPTSNEKQLATIGCNPETWLWETNQSAPVAHLSQPEAIVAVTFSPNSQYLAAASLGGIAVVQEVTSGVEIGRMAHEKTINSIAFSPDGRYLATASDDCTVRVWEVTTVKELACITYEDKVNLATFSPNGELLATASGDLMSEGLNSTPCLCIWHFQELMTSHSLKL